MNDEYLKLCKHEQKYKIYFNVFNVEEWLSIINGFDGEVIIDPPPHSQIKISKNR